MFKVDYNLFLGMTSVLEKKVAREKLKFVNIRFDKDCNTVFSSDGIIALLIKDTRIEEDPSLFREGQAVNVPMDVALDIAKIKPYYGEVIFSKENDYIWNINVSGFRRSNSLTVETFLNISIRSDNIFPKVENIFPEPDEISSLPSVLDPHQVAKLQKAVALVCGESNKKATDLIYIHHNGNNICPVSTYRKLELYGLIMPLKHQDNQPLPEYKRPTL